MVNHALRAHDIAQVAETGRRKSNCYSSSEPSETRRDRPASRGMRGPTRSNPRSKPGEELRSQSWASQGRSEMSRSASTAKRAAASNTAPSHTQCFPSFDGRFGAEGRSLVPRLSAGTVSFAVMVFAVMALAATTLASSRARHLSQHAVRSRLANDCAAAALSAQLYGHHNSVAMAR